MHRFALKTSWLIPLSLIVLINLLRFFPSFVEAVYSNDIYIAISYIMRILFGWLPFSIGDIFYAAAAVFLTGKFLKYILYKIINRISWKELGNKLLKFLRICMWFYIAFYALWGLNYYRQGIVAQLELDTKYNQTELERLLDEVVDKINENRLLISSDTVFTQLSFTEIKIGVKKSYEEAEKEFSFLNYNIPSLKKSMYSGIAHYMGFTGYFNPFSGEGNVRSTLPNIMQPYILCHETAHQLGYGSEDEANFVGYIAASNSNDARFRYSVYLDIYGMLRSRLLLKMINNKIQKDSAFAKFQSYNDKLDTLVRYDRRKIREYFFNIESKNSQQASAAVMSFYDKYLKLNNQPNGVDTYSDVVGWLIAYRKKYGKI